MKNRFFLGCVTGLAILVGVVHGLVSTAIAGSTKVDVCHVEGTGATHIITIADPALPSHVAHGDHVVEPELCDGIDNDCDGEIDDIGLTYTLRATANKTAKPLWQDTYLKSTRTIFFGLDIQGSEEIIQNYYSSSPVLRFQAVIPATLGGGIFWEQYFPLSPTSGETLSCGQREWLVSLPVDGTQITLFGLYGTWTAIVYDVGGNIIATTNFTITP